MSRKRKHVYKVGDVVRITNPLFVVRVGYPWNKQYVIENIITPEQKKALDIMFEAYELRAPEGYAQLDVPSGIVEKIREKIVDELAYGLLHKHRYGGRVRQIHTEVKEKWKDKPARVIGKRVVKTGEYIPGHGGYDYYNGGYDYDPPYLANEKTHVLLKLDIFSDDEMWAISGLYENLMEPEIEEAHVIPFVKNEVLEEA